MKNNTPSKKDTASASLPERQKKEAEALRENLRKRKERLRTIRKTKS